MLGLKIGKHCPNWDEECQKAPKRAGDIARRGWTLVGPQQWVLQPGCPHDCAGLGQERPQTLLRPEGICAPFLGKAREAARCQSGKAGPAEVSSHSSCWVSPF